MTTVISGDTPVSQVQAGSINQDDLAANVVGKGPAFSAYQTGVTSVTPAFTKITIQAELFDTNTAFDSTTNYRFQPAVAGYYQINGAVQFATANYLVRAALYKNGTVCSYGLSAVANATSVSDLVYLNGSTDYVELWGVSSTTQNTASGSALTYLSGFLARAA